MFSYNLTKIYNFVPFFLRFKSVLFIHCINETLWINILKDLFVCCVILILSEVCCCIIMYWLYHRCEFLLQNKGPSFVNDIVRKFPNLPRPVLRSGYDVPPPRSSPFSRSNPPPDPVVIDPKVKFHLNLNYFFVFPLREFRLIWFF